MKLLSFADKSSSATARTIAGTLTRRNSGRDDAGHAAESHGLCSNVYGVVGDADAENAAFPAAARKPNKCVNVLLVRACDATRGASV